MGEPDIAQKRVLGRASRNSGKKGYTSSDDKRCSTRFLPKSDTDSCSFKLSFSTCSTLVLHGRFHFPLACTRVRL